MCLRNKITFDCSKVAIIYHKLIPNAFTMQYPVEIVFPLKYAL